jgi:DNA-binding MarR family transcriptional regulator
MNEQTATTTDVRAEVATRLAVVVGRINRRIRPANGLSHGLVSALASIVNRGPLRPGDLARLESVAAPTMTRIIADLENRGLVVRSSDPVDGRAFFIEATPSGTEAVLQARAQRAAMVAQLLEECTEEQVLAISGALEGLELAAAIDRALPTH